LVTEDANAPGVELELLGSIAQDLGLRLQVTRHAAIGRSFNPRDWRITRAQCLLIAGGIPDTANTRSFLSVTAPHTETGWAAITLDPQLASLQGVSVGFLPGLTGLDRIALSAYLRNQGASLTILSSRPQAIEGLRSGSLQVVVSDSMVVGNLMAEVGGSGSWLPVAGSPSPVGFGMWKGDLTLERAIERSLQRLRQRGVLAEILDRYALEPLAECGYCR
jgi:polar amino acid transport system substrate-binding protein/cystine transport system substrate-binding protein/membrane-bound lytic murein transglycosylase F